MVFGAMSLVDFFRGAWSFTREVADEHSGIAGEASGQCDFTEEAPGVLRYREQGKLRLHGVASPVGFRREFVYRFDTDAGGVEVFFADGGRDGVFYQGYRLQDEALVPVCHHQCGPDAYSARYRLLGADHFEMATTIDGAAKKSRLMTRYSRQTGG